MKLLEKLLEDLMYLIELPAMMDDESVGDRFVFRDSSGKIFIPDFLDWLKIENPNLITRNAWGAFSVNSHINQHTGKPKVTYNTVETASKSAEKMGEKYNTHFSYYKCLFCDGYHIGKNRDNKTEYDKKENKT